MIDASLILKKAAEQAITKENILIFLKTVKNNVSLSVLNQLLIYIQNPDAVNVCGINALKEINRTVNEGAKAISMLFPQIDKNLHCEYSEISAYDFNDTTGEEQEFINLNSSIVDEIYEISGIAPDFVSPELLNGKKGIYDKENKTFLFSRDLNLSSSDKDVIEYNKLLIELYIEYIFDNYNIDNKMLLLAIKYVLFERYNLTHDIKEALFFKLNKYSTEEKINFAVGINFFVNGIVQDFEQYYLDFNETALINDLLSVADKADIVITLDNVAAHVDEEILRDDLIRLKSKILRLDDVHLNLLINATNEQRLFTFPFRQLPIRKTDYLQEERKRMLHFEV